MLAALRDLSSMRSLQNSSGDLVVDRRAVFAAAFAHDKDFEAAAEIMAGALDLVPGWTAGWCLLGDYRVEAGDISGAIAAYRELARLDATGVFGAALKLAALGASPLPRGTDTVYVEALFDDYAARFEAELLAGLRYEAPARLAGLVEAELGRRKVQQVGNALDLGCGTGLMGERLRRRASFLVGVDLSGGMIDAAARKGIYDRLEKAELTAFLAESGGEDDLVTAADVLNYCGALTPVFGAVFARLAPGGLFAFTLERHEGPEPLVLRSSLRYAHQETASLAACRGAGFELVATESAPLRMERGKPIVGLLVLAARPASGRGEFAVAEGDMPAGVLLGAD